MANTNATIDHLEEYLRTRLGELEAKYNFPAEGTIPGRFRALIRGIANQGLKVVVLIDEYDALRRMYAGFRFSIQFSKRKVHLYSPYSIIHFMYSGILQNYWFNSGVPTYSWGDPRSMVRLPRTVQSSTKLAISPSRTTHPARTPTR